MTTNRNLCCRKVFLDAVVISGTGPAALLIRDIVKESDEPLTIARLFATLPAYIRNPTENLAKEFEVNTATYSLCLYIFETYKM